MLFASEKNYFVYIQCCFLFILVIGFVICLCLIDRRGRKPLMLTGLIGVGMCHIALGIIERMDISHANDTEYLNKKKNIDSCWCSKKQRVVAYVTKSQGVFFLKKILYKITLACSHLGVSIDQKNKSSTPNALLIARNTVNICAIECLSYMQVWKRCH